MKATGIVRRIDDLEYDQMSLKEYIDPFTCEPVVMILWGIVQFGRVFNRSGGMY